MPSALEGRARAKRADDLAAELDMLRATRLLPDLASGRTTDLSMYRFRYIGCKPFLVFRRIRDMGSVADYPSRPSRGDEDALCSILVRRLGAGDARALQELYERYARRAYSLARRIPAPLWTTAVLVQAATRDGYDITRHPASMLANGNFGWVRVATFLVTGALMLGCAAGAGGTLLSASGRIWVPRLITAQGLGLLVAGVLRMDPGDGFPAGTPAGPVTTMSWHATIHNLAGTIVFLAMIATCLVLARRFRGTWAWTGRTCGVGFATGLVWCYGGGTAGALTLFLGVVIAWSWISATAARLTQS